ncbi:MAG: fatty acyl-AMP ligase [Bdellovibrionota bacterium]
MSEQTVVHALLKTAATGDSNRGFRFLNPDGSGDSHVSFAELADSSARYGAALLAMGLKRGDRVGLIVPENEQFVRLFFGAMFVGLVPVPIAPPMNIGRLGVFLEHLRHIVERSGSSLIVTSSRIKSVLGSLVGGSLKRVATPGELDVQSVKAPLADISPEQIAFLQFTSGSTSRPKGVALTHANLSVNTDCIMRQGLKVSAEDVGCSWLPLFHDMGLIGFVIAPVTTGTPVVLMSPLTFVKRPVEWLRMMSRYQGSLSFGPNFAYGLCVKRIKPEELEGVDLSRWRVAGCGAEPIQAATLRTFAERFSVQGFREQALMPSFGMAESTLAVTFSPLDRALRSDSVDVESLAKHRALSVEVGSPGSVQIVSCGSPFAEHDVAILGKNGELLPERCVGEIVLRGPSVMKEYYEDPEATASAFSGEWLRTGDLGYLADRELFVSGREKEVIIISGKNYYPTDLEFVISEIDGVRKGNVVVFGLADVVGGTEAIVVCAETKCALDEHKRIEHEIRTKVLEAFSLKIDRVELLAPNVLPKTSSGKLQRTKLKESYLSGELQTFTGGNDKLEFLKHWTRSQWKYLTKGGSN